MKVYCVFEFVKYECDDLRAIFHDKLMAEEYAEEANSKIKGSSCSWHYYVCEWEVQ